MDIQSTSAEFRRGSGLPICCYAPGGTVRIAKAPNLNLSVS